MKGTSLRAASEQNVEGEGAAVGAGGVLEGGYSVFGFVNELHDPTSGKSYVRGIVGLLALPLHKNESSPKGLDFRGKGAHGRSVIALVSGVPMFQRPVGLYPSCSSSARAGEPVGAAMGEGVKQGIVGGTHGSAQFSLAGATPASTHSPRR